MNHEILELRQKINLVDSQIINLLKKRVEIVKQIQRLKVQEKIPYLDEVRRDYLFETRKQWGRKLGLNSKYIEELYKKIHNYSLGL